MKKIKTTIGIALTMFAAIGTMAQSNIFIKGDMNINYNTHQNPPGTKGIQDDYNININVANSVIYHGKMTDRPQIIEGTFGFNNKITQPRTLKYDIDCDIINPAFAKIAPANTMVDTTRLNSTKNVGKLRGLVPISSDGVYQYDKSTLVMDILPTGNAGGFTVKFTGNAAGKPLIRPSNWTDTLRESVNIDRLVNGKATRQVLTKYDKMDFQNVVLAQGPVQIYQNVTINGTMLYDYDKNCWFFNNFTVQYAEGNSVKIDRIAGTIKWVKDPQRHANGLSEYQFDVRVNEPLPDANAAFSAASDESAAFSNDTTVPGLSGTMKYKDRLKNDGSEDWQTLSSTITIDLIGNNITKPQVMVLAKTIIFAAVIPMNSD